MGLCPILIARPVPTSLSPIDSMVSHRCPISTLSDPASPPPRLRPCLRQASSCWLWLVTLDASSATPDYL
jgi:hypothetical protein